MNRQWIFRIFLLLLALLFVWVSFQFRTPFFLKVRHWLPWSLSALAGLLALTQFRKSSGLSRGIKRYHYLLGILFLVAASLPSLQEWRFQYVKNQVLRSNPQLLKQLGVHFVVGYTNFEQIKTLVSHGAVGGIFITQRNIAGRTKAEVIGELQSLQQIQASQGLPPLWIAADQEGGLVSRLSPLVRELPPLSALDGDAVRIREYAAGQARDLAALGVNVNFSPVVDLKPLGKADPSDRHSLIAERAIAADPKRVTQVAEQYSRSLLQHGVIPTLKHFPGLALVKRDTHFHMGEIAQSLSSLASRDWLPFRKILQSTEAFLMLGHVKVLELDPDYPASLSQKLIQKVLRDQWGFQGILITDDFAMEPIYRHPEALGGAALRSLNAGVDLILLAYDGDLYYETMFGLLRAQERGDLSTAQLARSEERLARAKSHLTWPESRCFGTRRAGRIERAWPLPASGPNFAAYSQLGVWLGRNYVHSRVYRTLLNGYAALQNSLPGVRWIYGETGLKAGGKIWPHVTHQNGLSVDHMVPLKNKRGEPVAFPAGWFNRFGYDVEFDSKGGSGAYQIDFNALAEFLYQLDVAAKREGIGIRQVIFDPQLQKQLHSTRRWAYLKKQVRFSKYPSRVRHDEHVHVDFKVSCEAP